MNRFTVLRPVVPYLLPVVPLLVVLALFLLISASGKGIVTDNGTVDCAKMFKDYNSEAKYWISILVLSSIFAPIINFTAVASDQVKQKRVVGAVCSYLLLASVAIAQPKGQDVNRYARAVGAIYLSDMDTAGKHAECRAIFVDRLAGRFDTADAAIKKINGMEIGKSGQQ